VFWLWITVGIVVLLLLVLVYGYNRLVRLRQEVNTGWSNIDVQLERRADLIPNLVEAVKGYAAHERTVFEHVTEARAALQRAGSPRAAAEADDVLTAALGRLFAVAEAYPELRASENFQQLQAQLADTEDKIRVARQVYNDTVLTYENARETVPTNLVASMFSFEGKPFFEIEEPVREAPRVQF
jgi:LemA protein